MHEHRQPSRIENEQELIDQLSSPTTALIDFISSISGRLLILGAAGKMGPTLALMAKRAAEEAGHSLEVVAASRFSSPHSRQWFKDRGIGTVKVDLLQRTSIAQLPDAGHVISLIGIKFGTRTNPSLTWATNAIAPFLIGERFPGSKLVALSTGNVYPMVPSDSTGAREDHPLNPIGEYPNAAVARERIFAYSAQQNDSPLAILRLSYAVELRYGVLVDIAQRVWNDQPINISNPRLNWIWQGDASDLILRSFSLASIPASVFNLTQPHPFQVRDIAEQFGSLMGRKPRIQGTESPTSLLSDSSRLCQALGAPATSLDQVLPWIAQWLMQNRPQWNKPTHFEVRNGAY